MDLRHKTSPSFYPHPRRPSSRCPGARALMAAQLPEYNPRHGLDGGPATLHRSRTPLLAVCGNRSRSQPFQVCAMQRHRGQRTSAVAHNPAGAGTGRLHDRCICGAVRERPDESEADLGRHALSSEHATYRSTQRSPGSQGHLVDAQVIGRSVQGAVPCAPTLCCPAGWVLTVRAVACPAAS